MTERTLDYVPRLDERNRAYRVSAPPVDLTGRSRWWTGGVVLDQTPIRGLDPPEYDGGGCVGHGTVGEYLASPVRGALPTVSDPRSRAAAGHSLAVQVYAHAKEIDEWEGECVDMQTQALTRTGWKNGDQLAEGEEILTFDLETETTRWAVVEKVHRYASKPYRIWAVRGFQAAVTDNHRWPVRMRPNGSGFPRPFRMTTTTEWRASDEILRAAPCGDLPTEAKWDDDLVELIAWVITEGSYRPAHRRGTGVVVAQKVHRERVAELMARLGAPRGSRKADGCHTWEISGPLSRQIREIAPDRAVRVDWLASLTQRQLRLFLDVCTMGDGHTTPAAGRRQSCDVFMQKPGPILDSWLAAAVLAGQPVSRGAIGAVETWTLRRSGALETRQLRPSPYISGPVWCPQTDAGTFVAKRGGTVFVTGNSYEGTSVRAGMLVARERGWCAGFRWAFNMTELRAALEDGPVVIGFEVFERMWDTEPDGDWIPEGPSVGWHCALVSGYSANYARRGPRYRIRNSWGADWGAGSSGNAYMAPEHLERVLFTAGGEAAIPAGRHL